MKHPYTHEALSNDALQEIYFLNASMGNAELPHDHAEALQAVADAVTEAAIARMKAVPWQELDGIWCHTQSGDEEAFNAVRARLIDAARVPINLESAVGAIPGSFAKTCDDPKTGELPMTVPEPDAVDWKSKYEALELQAQTIGKMGADAQERVEKLEAELARLQQWKSEQLQVESEWDCQMLAKKLGVGIGQSCRAGIQKAVLALLEQPALSRLRPLAEAGPVPEGAVRYYFRIRSDKSVSAGTQTRMRTDTHYANILMPESPPIADAVSREDIESKQPAVEDEQVWADQACKALVEHAEQAAKREPAIFKAHGKEWTRHTPGDPMPCDGERKVDVYTQRNKDLKDWFSLPKRGDYWSWESPNIIGWRYADEPTPATAPAWQPSVGDVVTLKSGSPKMSICLIEGTVCKCQWFRNDEADVEFFEIATLQPA